MKNWIFLSVCLVVLFASTTSFAQSAAPGKTPGSEGQRDPQKVCPIISVSCPGDPNFSEPLDFNVTVRDGDPNAKPTYTWQVYGGVIVEGQGTAAIRVRMERAGKTVTGTVHVGGLDPVCANTASCSTPIILLALIPQKLDSYGLLTINRERARLDLFAAALKGESGAQGYILGYGGRRSHKGEAQKALERAKEYLVQKVGIDEGRIVTVDGGFKQQFTVDLWLVHSGSVPPIADPTVDPTEVELTKPSKARRP